MVRPGAQDVDVVLDHDGANAGEVLVGELHRHQATELLRRGRALDEHRWRAQHHHRPIGVVAHPQVAQAVAPGITMKGAPVNVGCPQHVGPIGRRLGMEVTPPAVPHQWTRRG